MDFLFELIFELILEGSIEASKSSKIPKPIRYILIFLICLFFLFIISLFIIIGIDLLKENKIGGIIIIIFGILFALVCLYSFIKVYIKKSKKDDNNEED